MLEFGSVCSGVEAASVAWLPLGWTAAWLAEIEPFPSAVLAHRYPDTPNLGDMTALPDAIMLGEVAAPDVLVGGTPCQGFSMAGLRGSLDDPRGQLTLTYVKLLNAIDEVRKHEGKQPTIAVWENVPGVLNTKDNAFGNFLAALAGETEAMQPPGRRWGNAGYIIGPRRQVAWRVLDAQYFGLAQRRKRVFVVASAGTICPATVLFEFEGVRRDSAPGRVAGQDAAGAAADSTDATLCMAHGQANAEVTTGASPTLTCVHEAPIVTVYAGTQNDACRDAGADISPTIRAGNNGGAVNVVVNTPAVRRLTPRECERLQGFQDDHAAVPWRGKPAGECPDGHRYKALGNSMAVPVMRWIGARITAQLIGI